MPPVNLSWPPQDHPPAPLAPDQSPAPPDQ